MSPIRGAGKVRGRTFFVSTSGLLFLAPVRCRTGELVDLEIFIRSTVSIRCKARIVGEGTPYQVDFVEFASGDFKAWNDTLLDLHRASIKRW